MFFVAASICRKGAGWPSWHGAAGMWCRLDCCQLAFWDRHTLVQVVPGRVVPRPPLHMPVPSSTRGRGRYTRDYWDLLAMSSRGNPIGLDRRVQGMTRKFQSIQDG
ncbi:hypothetical protein GGI42DRAFT_302607 [Trichoderma sp. SZMC 28013]